VSKLEQAKFGAFVKILYIKPSRGSMLK